MPYVQGYFQMHTSLRKGMARAKLRLMYMCALSLLRVPVQPARVMNSASSHFADQFRTGEIDKDPKSGVVCTTHVGKCPT